MSRKAVAFLGVVLALVACNRADRVEEAFKVADEASQKTEDRQEKVRIARDFLTAYPDSDHTMDMARRAVYPLVFQLEQPADADSVLVEVLGKVTNSETRRGLLELRVLTLGRLHRGDDLAGVVEEMAALGPLAYSDHESVIESALEAGAWELALRNAEAAIPLCTVAAYQADYPERKFGEQELAQRAARRLAWTLAAKGWSLSNLGRTEEALATFDEADQHDRPAFAGNSDALLGAYRGRTLVRLGRYQEALAVLAPDAIFGADEEALAAMRQAFVAVHGDEAGFDPYLWDSRVAMARPVADFTLADYEGHARTFSTLRNGEVTLLAFWFPT